MYKISNKYGRVLMVHPTKPRKFDAGSKENFWDISIYVQVKFFMMQKPQSSQNKFHIAHATHHMVNSSKSGDPSKIGSRVYIDHITLWSVFRYVYFSRAKQFRRYVFLKGLQKITRHFSHGLSNF